MPALLPLCTCLLRVWPVLARVEGCLAVQALQSFSTMPDTSCAPVAPVQPRGVSYRSGRPLRPAAAAAALFLDPM